MSLGMRIAARFVRFTRKRERTPDELQRAYRGRPPPRAARVGRGLTRLADVRETTVDGRLVFTATPRRDRSRWHVIYTHGGWFVNELIAPHWDIVAALVRATGATVTVPLYPLAPEHSHADAFAFLERVYRDASAGSDRIVLCGDSAGGNLALVQALRYRELGLAMPAHLILFAPVLDLTLSNPEIARVQPRDPMLWIGEGAEFSRWWAGDVELKHPLLSPVHADLAGLPPIQIYQGADDILAPDARVLRDRIAAAGGRVDYHETAGAFHVFMGATFTPEAKQVFREIGRTLMADARR